MSFSLIALCPFPYRSCQEEKSILNSLYINQYGSTRQASTFSFTERLLRWFMVKFNNLWQPYSIQRNHPATWDYQFLSVRLDSGVCYILALLLSIPGVLPLRLLKFLKVSVSVLETHFKLLERPSPHIQLGY